MPIILLLLGSIFSLVIFCLATFSENQFRFVYLAAPFFLAWLISLLADVSGWVFKASATHHRRILVGIAVGI